LQQKKLAPSFEGASLKTRGTTLIALPFGRTSRPLRRYIPTWPKQPFFGNRLGGSIQSVSARNAFSGLHPLSVDEHTTYSSPSSPWKLRFLT